MEVHVLRFEQRKAFYTPRDVATLARVDPKTVMSWVHAGKLNAIRLSPRVYRIPLAAVVKLLYPDAVRSVRIERAGGIPRPGSGERLPLARRVRSRHTATR